MITFDLLRTALLGPEPHTGLDRLVRTELASSRKTKAIYDEILGHLDAVRAMPEYSDEVEESIGDTLDALWGWGNPAYWYKDSPTSNGASAVPTSGSHAPPTAPKNE